MSAHTLAEEISGLASRVNNMATHCTGEDSRTFYRQQQELSDRAMAAIIADLDAEEADYKKAVAALKAANEALGEADKAIANVADGIKKVAAAIKAVSKVLPA